MSTTTDHRAQAAIEHLVMRGGYGETTFARITYRLTAEGVAAGLQAATPFRELLTRSLSAWIRDTDEGRDFWRGTSYDANIGDLGALGIPEYVQQAMKEAGVVDLKVDVYSNSEPCRDWTYDTYLVDDEIVRTPTERMFAALRALPLDLALSELTFTDAALKDELGRLVNADFNPSDLVYDVLQTHDRIPSCRTCGGKKTHQRCGEVEFACGGRDLACEGWSGSCCACGHEYAHGQI